MRKRVSIGKERFFALCYEDCRYAGKDNECYAVGHCARLENDLYEPISEKGELLPEGKIKAFIKDRNYTYSIDDVLEDYAKKQSRSYGEHSLNDCVEEVKMILKR